MAVHLDYSWFIFFFLVVFTFARFYFPQAGYPRGEATMLGLAAGVLLVFSVLFHELSHAVTSNRLGFPIRQITLFVFGGVAHMEAEPDRPRTELLVAAAGPVSSLALWGAFAGAAAATVATSWSEVFRLTSQLNLVLALFNLVPGFPLDGGRLLRALVWSRSGSLLRATNVAARGGEIFAWFLMLAGVVTMFLDGGFVTGIWYILVGIFVKNAAEQSYQSVAMRELMDGISVREVMGRNLLAVSTLEPLDRVIEGIFLHHKFTEYPVVDESGAVCGILDIDDIRRVPREERAGRLVRDVMQSVPQDRLPRPATRALEALSGMAALAVRRLPVVDDAGHLAGIVSRSDIMSMFHVRNDLG